LTAVYRDKGTFFGLVYTVVGVGNEAGEALGKVKKAMRGDKELDGQALADEIGDVLWYCASVASELGVTLDEIADQNLRKLQSRKERGVLKGSGDNR
jgi:NTP pyrophosphatase (non-canonical NTP hydrolase)